MYAIREVINGKMGPGWVGPSVTPGELQVADRANALWFPTPEAAREVYRQLALSTARRWLIVRAEEDRK